MGVLRRSARWRAPGLAAEGGGDPGERSQAVLHRVEPAEADEQAEVGHGRDVHGEAERRVERA